MTVLFRDVTSLTQQSVKSFTEMVRKVNYSFYFGLRKLPTEEAFSMLRDNVIIAMLLMYEVAPVTPFTQGIEFIYCFQKKTKKLTSAILFFTFSFETR